MTFDIASVLLLGSQSGAVTQNLSKEFTKFSQGLFTLPWNIPLTPYNKAIKAREHLLKHIEQVVLERQRNPQNDALGLLIQSEDPEGNRLSLEEIKAQALLMLFSGHETTTSMLTSFCLALGQQPSIIKKAREEQHSLNIGERLNIEQLRNMPYLDTVFKEVERLYPPVIGGFRGIVKSFSFGGYSIPSGWQLLYLNQGAHKDPQIYTNVDQFDPERFNIARAENCDYALVGFGGGSRICLGMAFAQMEMKIFASYLLRYYHWEILPNQDLTLQPIPTLHPRSGLKIKFSTLLPKY
jgi:cytochrome P450